MQKINVCLGLDISSTTIGYCFSSSKTKILSAGFVDISKKSDITQKAHHFAEIIDKIDFGPDIIIVEDTLSGYGGGRTSQQTIIKLAKCNAVVSYVIEALYGVEINHINVSTLRKSVLGKSREKGVDSKTFVREQLENKIDLSKFIVYNSRKNYDKRNYDMLDAIVASLYYWYSLK
tara:strand:- start:5165 stop:5692 length:528 start_codon:yes stop_codon:yes gene_type:complete